MMRRAAMQSRKELSLDMLREMNILGKHKREAACAGARVLYGREIETAGIRGVEEVGRESRYTIRYMKSV
jgi:PP-loop superfamily ATP-utilizing enzyme